MRQSDFLPRCRAIVAKYTNEHMDKTDGEYINPEDVFVVWYAKTLQNSKALLSTPVTDGMYYEITYNGDNREIYFDAYKKFENRRIDAQNKRGL